VRVADTGISEAHRSAGFPESYVRRNADERSGREGRDAPPPNGYLYDFHGISADRDGVLDPPRGMDHGWHGAEVAHLVLGGRAFRDIVPSLEDLLRVTFARLFTDVNRRVPMADPAALVASLTTWRPPPEIVNFSVGGPSELPDLLQALEAQAARQQLLVVAAGNDGRDLARDMAYPASYAVQPELAAFMLVVDAHGPTGEIARFSNRGAEAVHILAPSCRIPRSADPADPPLAGTSFAAPLVSFTAGLIHALMPEPSIRRIRERLWTTARHVSDEVAAQVAFGGVLDMAAALRFHQDVVRRPDGGLLAGRWGMADPVELCQGEPPMDVTAIARIRVVPARGDQPLALRVLERLPVAVIGATEIVCRPQIPGIAIAGEDGRRHDLAWHEMAAFIPAMLRSEELVPPQAEATAELQEGLRAVLLSVMPPTAAPVGPLTRDAVRAFQELRQEPASGVLTRDQASTLLRAARRAAP
jgi:hypothetical protein